MKRRLRTIGGWVGSGIMLALALVGIGLVSGTKLFVPPKREEHDSIT
ncbi:MAG TPA: hypothetical protein VIJ29_04505 [Candidatus Paceibacterota bacterium]